MFKRWAPRRAVLLLSCVIFLIIVVLGLDTREVHAATIIVDSNITTDATWTGGNVYVLTQDITVLEGVELSIQAGAIVKPQPNTRLLVNGVLKAQGTAGDHVVFTSYKDDDYGGDTNGDGSASAAAPNDWGWIQFNNSSVDAESILEHCTIRYGGRRQLTGWDYYGAVYLVDASPTLANCTISQTGTYAVGINTGSFPTITGNTFVDNTTNGIGVYGGTMTTNGSWSSTNYPYVLHADVTVGESAELTIVPGAVVKPKENARLIVDGVLKAQGTASNHVVFTSYKDDSNGGDTNGDGSASAPAPNDWGWIQFNDSSVDAENILEYCTVRYGGKDGSTIRGGVRVYAASPTIRNCVITQNRHGIWTENNALPAVTGNAIFRNEGYGFYNASKPLVVSAENNWWGDASGPYDPSDDPDDPTGLYNPDGLGDQVTDYVDYDPWWVTPLPHPFIRVEDSIFLPDEAGQIHVTLMYGHSFELSVPLNCGPSTVTASFTGVEYDLSDPERDGVWTGVIDEFETQAQVAPLTVTADGGSCDASPWQVASVTLIEPNGYLYDAVTENRISGAAVTVFRFDSDQQIYVLWDAYPSGQVNPQHTDDQGQYGWQLPAGSYYLVAQQADYNVFQSSPFTVPPDLNDFNIALGPIDVHLEVYLPYLARP